MLMYDLTSVIVGSAILAGLFVSIAIRRPKTIVALTIAGKRSRSGYNSNLYLTTLL
jgi:hypothetical protein